ncbi:MAG TPA: MFS transporter [Acidimicrobiales bacterium]|nr:MFS transporter [Acidimicrobiales bacterium]
MTTDASPEEPEHHHFSFEELVGGPARARVIILLASILGLQAADTGAVGALAAPLEKAFHIGNTELGLLVTVTTLVGCVATLPFGGIADRYNRTRLLQVVVALWAVATAVSALSVDYTMLLLSRLALGGVVAAAGPALASLVGDLFPSAERGRLWGYVLTGELIGAGVGILLAGGLSGLVDWRLALGVLSVPAAVLVWALRRYLPEPARGGQAYLQVGDEEIVTEEDVDPDQPVADGEEEPVEALADPSPLEVQAEEEGAEPEPEIVLTGAEDLSLWEATRYVLRIRTNVALIAASGLGYFFLSGLQTFAELYFRDRFGVSQSLASLLFIIVAAGALAGVVLSGRISDGLIGRGRTSARLIVGAIAYAGTAIAFVPGVLSATLFLAVPVFMIAAAFAGATNSPVDAARLDIMPSKLWGRAEAVRTALRQFLQGLAPLLYGLVSSAFGAASRGIGAGVNSSSQAASAATAHGLQMAFIVLTIPLLVAGAALWLSRHAYLREIVAARRSDENWAEAEAA